MKTIFDRMKLPRIQRHEMKFIFLVAMFIQIFPLIYGKESLLIYIYTISKTCIVTGFYFYIIAGVDKDDTSRCGRDILRY